VTPEIRGIISGYVPRILADTLLLEQGFNSLRKEESALRVKTHTSMAQLQAVGVRAIRNGYSNFNVQLLI
jgi:hypothetical protein